MNPLVFLFILGAALAAPQKLVETGLGDRFPIVYEYPRDNIILGKFVQQKGVYKTPAESVYPIGEQVRPIYVQTVTSGNHEQIDRPIQRVLLNRQYINDDDFPIYTPSGHIVHHGTPKPRPQSPTHEEEKGHVAPVRSFYPGSDNREIVYIYRPIQRQQFGEALRPIQPY